jgi:hypothetical protein
MTTVEQVALAALADLGEEAAGLVNAVRWANERLSQVASRKMKHRRKVGGLVIPAPITSGTVTATNASRVVVGNATAQAAWANMDMTHAFLQLSGSGIWYRVVALSSDNDLILDQPFTETTVSATNYRLVWRYVTLPDDIAFLGFFAHNRLRREVLLKSQGQLDMHFPDRVYVTSGPQYYSLFGESRGRKILEFYPYSTQTEYILFTYWEVPPVLAKEDPVPVPFTAHDLKVGIHADIYRFKAAQAADKEMMAMYANLEARQETRWEKTLGDIMRRDRDVEDLVLLFKSPQPELFVNRNARTEVYLRGNRP